MVTDASGDLNIFGGVGRKKHDKKVANFRYLTTMLQYGSSFGSNGPTEFIMKWKKCRNGCDERFLEKHGTAPGSTIAMTDNAFIIEKAWSEIAEKVGMCLCYSIFTFL